MKNPTLIYGKHPVLEAIQTGVSIDKVFLQQGTRGELEREVRQLCKHFDIPLQYTPKERFNKLVRGNHQGIAAYLSLVTYYKLEDLLPTIYEQSRIPLLIILDGVTDVRNFGAIARTVEGIGADALIIPQKNTAQINAEAVKTSAGVLTTLPVCRVHSLDNAIDLLQQSGIQVLASDLRADAMLYNVDFTLPSAIIMGAEDKGVRPHLIRKVDQRFIIPLLGTVDSYNVSVATGMILYEALRQRTNL